MTDRAVVLVDADLEDLIPTFMQRRKDDVIALRERLAESEFDTIRVMGHTLKGTAGGYGFQQLSAIGEAIEKAALREDGAAVASCADEMEAFLARVQVEFR